MPLKRLLSLFQLGIRADVVLLLVALEVAAVPLDLLRVFLVITIEQLHDRLLAVEAGQPGIALVDYLGALFSVVVNRLVVLVLGSSLSLLLFGLLKIGLFVHVETHPESEHTAGEVLVEIQVDFPYRS